MPNNKKLQIFVSSTYKDLKEERQAALKAILDSGNIPAGMELFAAGDKPQMEVIKKWIDFSDVYLLILGARYGSIEDKSKKSYTQLEYEYAVEQGKALFVCVIDEKEQEARIKNKSVTQDHPEKLKEFKRLVCNKIVAKFWKNISDIEKTIYTSIMNDFYKRKELVGWIRGDSIHEELPLDKQGEEFEFETFKIDASGEKCEQRKCIAKQQIEKAYDINLEMVYIKGGTFLMGSPDSEEGRYKNEGPQHQVTIPPFYMGKHPITQHQWKKIMGNEPSYFNPSCYL